MEIPNNKSFIVYVSKVIRKNKLLILIIFSFLILVCFLAYNLNIWEDEYFSLITASKDLKFAFNRALFFEYQPPVYFILLNVWLLLGGSPFIARLLSIIFILLSFWAVYKIIQKLKPAINPVWFLAIFAFNPFIIWAAVEIRVYALVILLSALLMLNFYNGYLSEDPSKKSRLFYSFIAVIALYTQYYLGFFLIVNAIILVFFRKWSSLKYYLFDMILPLIALITLIPIIPAQIQSQAQLMSNHIGKSAHLKFQQKINFIIDRLDTYIFSEIYIFVNYKLLRLSLFIFFLVSSWKFLPKFFYYLFSKKNFVLMITIFLLIIYFSIINIVGKDSLYSRHTASLFVPLMLSVFLIISFTNNLKVLTIWVIIFLSIYLINLVDIYSPMAKPGDAKRISLFLMKNENDNQPIFVEYKYLHDVTGYYYKGKNSTSFLFEYNTISNIDSLHSFYNTLIKSWKKRGHVWYISDYNNNDKYLRENLENNFIIQKEKKFYGDKTVYLLGKKN